MSLSSEFSGAHDRLTEDARFMILRELASQVDRHLNSISLRSVLEHRYGVRRSPEWLETQLNKLAELGAVAIRRGGAILIAEILPAGIDHLEERAVIAGITAPRNFR